jgi:Protein of unknown function (DUF5818)
MNKMLLSIFTALVFFVAVAVAQSTPQGDTSGAQGTQSSSPAASQGSTGSSASQGSTSSSGSMSQGSMGAENKTEAKGEKKLKGCIKSEGGQSVLEEKSGKTVNLTGSDVSAHNGHEVTVHGTWEGGASATASGSSGAATAKAGKTFNVTSVDMISDSCTGGKTKGGASSTPPPTGQQ